MSTTIVYAGEFQVNTHRVGNKSVRLAGNYTATCHFETMSGPTIVDAYLHKRRDCLMQYERPSN